MKSAFNAAHGLIEVQAEVVGPTGSRVLRLGLDTGAHRTVIDPDNLSDVGYDLSNVPATSTATTASGVIHVRRLPIIRLTALGRSLDNLTIISHQLPPSANIDGLLGLDFLRGQVLTINFQKGEITLDPGTSASPTP
jgi:predicted aspartyl protease